MDQEMLNWFLSHATAIDSTLMIVGVIIEVLITAGIYIIWKKVRKKNDS